jgi:hypothetical protein
MKQYVEDNHDVTNVNMFYQRWTDRSSDGGQIRPFVQANKMLVSPRRSEPGNV